jgi:cytochrome o ubiquinol oxidase operon protein cyoD
MTNSPSDKAHDTRGTVAGYLTALVLTLAAFAVVRWPSFDRTATLAIVFGLALVQAVVHFRFFLHVGLKSASRDNLVLLLFSAVIVILMVSGTLIVLLNLRHRMM